MLGKLNRGFESHPLRHFFPSFIFNGLQTIFLFGVYGTLSAISLLYVYAAVEQVPVSATLLSHASVYFNSRSSYSTVSGRLLPAGEAHLPRERGLLLGTQGRLVTETS